MKIIYIIFSVLFTVPLLASANSEDHFLHGLCRYGAFYPTEECPLTQDMLAHADKNTAKIKELVEGGPYGTLLILGPGPGSDLPLSYLVEKFHHIIMIDGFLDPMREWVEQNPHNKHKITLIQYDLSGGFYSFITDNKERVIDALSRDILLCEESENCRSTNYQKLLSKTSYPLEFRSYKPDVIISSLVTSQISAIGEIGHYMLVNEAFNRVKKYMKSAENDKINIRNNIFLTSCHDNRHLHTNTYYTALIESDAKKIYFSDTIRPGYLPDVLFDNFCNNIGKKYNSVAKGKSAWPYKPELPVCYVSFLKKQQCHECASYVDTIRRCSTCKKAKYCGKECQRKAWPVHKKECRP